MFLYLQPIILSDFFNVNLLGLITLVTVIGSVIFFGKDIFASIKEMKPEVKKVPVIEKTVSVLEKTLDNIGRHL